MSNRYLIRRDQIDITNTYYIPTAELTGDTADYISIDTICSHSNNYGSTNYRLATIPSADEFPTDFTDSVQTDQFMGNLAYSGTTKVMPWLRTMSQGFSSHSASDSFEFYRPVYTESAPRIGSNWSYLIGPTNPTTISGTVCPLTRFRITRTKNALTIFNITDNITTTTLSGNDFARYGYNGVPRVFGVLLQGGGGGGGGSIGGSAADGTGGGGGACALCIVDFGANGLSSYILDVGLGGVGGAGGASNHPGSSGGGSQIYVENLSSVYVRAGGGFGGMADSVGDGGNGGVISRNANSSNIYYIGGTTGGKGGTDGIGSSVVRNAVYLTSVSTYMTTPGNRILSATFSGGAYDGNRAGGGGASPYGAGGAAGNASGATDKNGMPGTNGSGGGGGHYVLASYRAGGNGGNGFATLFF